MKKIFILMMMAFLAIGIVSAAGTGVPGEGVPGEGIGGMNGSAEKVGSQMAKLQGEGQMMFGDGKVMEFSQEGERIQLKTGEHTAECEGCDLNQENGKLMAKMSNGQNSEIKIMPDKANEQALERLQLKNCGEDCSIELKEVGKGEGNNTRAAYEIQIERHSRFLAVFKAKMLVKAQVDAETGEIIRVKKPWWAFLAVEPEEE